MDTLLHICCAPCSIMCVETLRSEGIAPTGYWFNPNIHPFTEYKARKNTLVNYAKEIGLKLEIRNEYGLRSFIQGIYPEFNNRCGYCYRARLEAAVAFAKENGFGSFSTTLLISPYQNHDLLRKTGEELAEEYGVPFLYRDFRPYFREGQDKARELGLYMQKYCGCIFSEEERYQKKKKKAAAEESGKPGANS